MAPDEFDFVTFTITTTKDGDKKLAQPIFWQLKEDLARAYAQDGHQWTLVFETSPNRNGLNGSPIRFLSIYDWTRCKHVGLYTGGRWGEEPEDETVKGLIDGLLEMIH